MPSAQERAKQLAQEMRKAVKEAKEAEARAKRLGEEVMQALAEAKVEAESSADVVEYPPGRYECKACRQPLLFMEPTRELTPCENCGGTEFVGHEPRVLKVKPPPPMKYPAGMYECAGCGARVALAEGVDKITPCDICGIAVLRAPQL
jgi:DNA-directed RNA polymerase subunit RPC12/RpoP